MNKFLSSLLIISFAIIMLSISNSCVKDEYDFEKVITPKWSPSIATPLINTRLALSRLLEMEMLEDIISEDENNLLFITYKKTFESVYAENIISIPNQNFNSSFNSINTMGILVSGDSLVIDLSTNFEFEFASNSIIDSIILKSGEMLLNISSNFNMPYKIEIEIENAKIDNNPFMQSFLINGSTYQNISLENTKLVFDNSINDNELEISYKIVLYGNDSPDNSPYSIDFNKTLQNIEFSRMFGYLGQLDFPMNDDTISVELFEGNLEGEFKWIRPRFTFSINNSFGIPVQVDLNNMIFFREDPPILSVPVNYSHIVPNPWDIDYPSKAQLGQSLRSTISFNEHNTNIGDIYDIKPQKAKVQLVATTNPTGYTSSNFVLDTSKIDIDLDVDIPIHASAEGFYILDTVEVSLFEDSIDNNLESLLLKIFTANTLPLDVELKLFFTDSLYNAIDTIIGKNEQIITSGVPGPAPDYIVNAKKSKSTTINIDRARIEDYDKVKYLIIRAELNTYNFANQPIKLYSNQDLHIIISAQVKLKL